MSSAISTLSPELLLRIVDFLSVQKQIKGYRSDGGEELRDQNARDDGSESDGEDSHRGWIDVVDIAAISALAHTCASFYNILCPSLFRSVKLRTKKDNSRAVNYLSTSRQAEHVHELHFIGYAPGDEEEYTGNELETVLPTNARQVLQNLHRFPNLSTVIVEFDFGFEDYNRWSIDGLPDELDLGGEESDSEDTMSKKETRETHRVLVVKTLDDIASNHNGVVKTLVYRNAFMQETTVFRTEKWQAFLSGLEEFRLGLLGYDNGAGWKINKLLAYPSFVANIGRNFLDHTSNITRLTLGADDEGAFGCEGFNHAPHPLTAEHLPKLQWLEIHYFFVDAALVDFLVGHKEVLQHLRLIDCASAAGDCSLAENPIYWDEFLNRWAESKPPALTHFEVLPIKMPDLEQDHLDIDRVYQVLKQDVEAKSPHVRQYLEYKYLDDKYGMLFTDDELNDERFLENEDWEAYVRVQNIAKKNRERQ